ncbi:claudin-4-like [Tiliqua scincoides]|uniref:claudin-4-like n=1 Tax=Tiliqua scincoides TaxID=71010 RepID=UPI00346259E7
MGSMGMQILGMALAAMGWLGTIVCCALPMWKVSAFMGNNILVSHRNWEGLWMNCVLQSTGQMQCQVYEVMLALPQDIQAARALVVIAILLAVLGLFLSILGGKCTHCLDEETSKARVVVAAGVIFLLSSILLLIPLCWTAHDIIRNFYSPMIVDSQKREFGPSLYIGWASCGLLLFGGTLLCCNCPRRKEKSYSAKYTATRSVPTSNYV